LGAGDTDFYEKQAAALQISDKITWAGLVKNATDYYAASDIFVLPTLSDAGPMAPLEAMAHGCAAIFSCATYDAGMAEVINNGEAVLLQTPREPAEIASAIERLMDPAIREDYAHKGRELVGKLTWNRTANIVIQALEKSAKERGRIRAG
jgi:glycosyltransferase involved in cell wall biosynthesis